MEKKLHKQILVAIAIFLLPLVSIGQNQISGNLTYYDIYGLEGVTAILMDNEGGQVATTITNSSGLYEFNNVPDGTYSVVFENEAKGGGIDLEDAYLVQLYLQGNFPLSDIQLLAADVNRSGNVTQGDYQLILNAYLNKGKEFDPEWVYEDVQIIVGERSVPITKAASAGDVNGTYVPEKSGHGSFYVKQAIDKLYARPGEQVKIELTSDQSYAFTGMHMKFQVPEGLTINSIESFSEVPAYYYFTEQGEYVVTWGKEQSEPYVANAGDPIVTMNVTVGESLLDMTELFINLSNESHFIDGNGQLIQFMNLAMPKVEVKSAINEEFQHTVYPNPFASNVNFSYELPADGKVSIKIYNAFGQLVQVAAEEYQSAGLQQVTLNSTTLVPGMYYYSIESEGANKIFARGSMIKSK